MVLEKLFSDQLLNKYDRSLIPNAIWHCACLHFPFQCSNIHTFKLGL